jgi:hypothetical protein
VVLFLGFAFLAGGMAGGVAVFVLKYVVGGEGKGLTPNTLLMGLANVLGNAGVMGSAVLLWVSQNMEDEYAYNLAL